MLNSHQVFKYSTIQVYTSIIGFGTYTSQYSCKHVGIQVNSSQARIRALREHDFG